MYKAPGRTDADQARAHARACIEYGREALARGDLFAADNHISGAESWLDTARDKDSDLLVESWLGADR